MNKNRLVKRIVVAAGFLFLCAAPGLSLDQNNSSGAVPPSHITSPPARPRTNTSPPDFFAGLTLTADQKVKVAQIHEDTKSRLKALANDHKLSPEVKDAMLQGYRRIENTAIFNVLTPDQQQEVRKRVAAWRVKARGPQHQSQQLRLPVRKSQPE